MNALITNISASGLHLKLNKDVDPGSALFLIMRFVSPSATVECGPLLRIEGRVLRVVPELNGEHGVALAITDHEVV
jgi:hypothetical protein